MYNPYSYMNPVTVPHVSSLEEARAYIIPNNSSILLLDSNQPFVYLKVTDQVGQSQVSKWKITEVKEPTASDIETRINGLESKLDALLEKVNLNAKPNAPKNEPKRESGANRNNQNQ